VERSRCSRAPCNGAQSERPAGARAPGGALLTEIAGGRRSRAEPNYQR
jgi:hypothetical protein